jgi:signal transduction histidine kinase/CheY-like chemotaxis protein
MAEGKPFSPAASVPDAALALGNRREADMDLALRLIHGLYFYPILLLLLGLTTGYFREHPSTVLASAAIIAAGVSLRLYVTLWRESLYDANPERWRGLLLLTIILSEGAAGVLFATTVTFYGVEQWTFTIVMIWTMGAASGATVIFTPNLWWMRLHLALLLLPSIIASVAAGGHPARTFAFAASMLLVFLLLQGTGLHRGYWRDLLHRARDAQRTRELEAAKQAAEAANVSKTQLLANMSHEIRTPMHGILGMAQLALSTESVRQQREYIEILRSSAEGLLGVLNDIVDLSKIEAGKLVLESIPFNVRQVVEQCCKVLSAQAEAKSLRLECILAPGLPEMVNGDPLRLRQVLLNLLGNAIKFTNNGWVRVTVATEPPSGSGDAVFLFAVADTGVGVPFDQQKKIFEAFAQADGSVTRRFGGAGLGLTICSQLVALMNGQIHVASVVNEGSTFSFSCRLGVLATPVHVPAPAPVPERDPQDTPLQILLAEDNLINQKVAVALLAKAGHKIEVVRTGVEAVSASESTEFDLILMDNQMPEMGGIEATHLIRLREATRSLKRVPIIALTANAMSGDRDRFLAAGMDGYLAKPFRAEDLHEAVRRFARHSTRS